ncbi:MAG: PilZ domain-containing protein [Gammaproteobacteria bacterium]|nr:MAG: PilZ domain-containing protein [Gammaproteobacteria bacterium]
MSLDDQDYAEKRDFIRMFINAPVDYAIADTGDWQSGIGKDLSGGGLSFSTEGTLSEGDKVDVKLQPITPVTPPLEAKVTVIRIDQNEDGKSIISTKIDRITS